ncbi:MAG: glycosyltransferase [Ferrimicrobium sp.]
MIGVAVCIGNEETYKRYALPSLGRQEVDGLLIVELRNQHSIHLAYNEALKEFRGHSCDAVILLHEDVELLENDIFQRVTQVFREHPSAALVGPVGARAVTSISWWEGEIRGKVSDSFRTISTSDPFVTVDTLDGMFLGVSQAGLGELNFDQTYPGFHGYDAEICTLARHLGKEVLTADLPMKHHTKGGYGDIEAFLIADEYYRTKWSMTLV